MKKHLTAIIFIVGLTLGIIGEISKTSTVEALTPSDIVPASISGYRFQVTDSSVYKYNAGNSRFCRVEYSSYVKNGDEVFINGVAFLDKHMNVIKSYYSNQKDSLYYREKSLDEDFIPKDTFSIDYHIRTNFTDLGWISPYDLQVITLYSSK